MVRLYLLVVSLLFSPHSFSQNVDTVCNSIVAEYVSVLASDSLGGRGNYTPELYKAASFIAAAFAKDSLKSLAGYDSYIIPFVPVGKLKDKWKDSEGNYDPEKVLFNVVGIIEGQTLPGEIIIFSAHFDHLGMTGKKKKSSNIFNGANDNASGTAAVMALARHYAKTRSNARTIMFCAFGGEELGLLGSTVLSEYLKPGQIVTVINFEMIGRHNVGGKNSFFITGAEYSDLDDIIGKNLEGTETTMVPEPDRSLKLFQRSDNLPFAMKKIPAHTIMSSNDGDECYHKTCDDISGIDFEHMKNIINAIIVSTKTIIEGKETPSRISKQVETLF